MKIHLSTFKNLGLPLINSIKNLRINPNIDALAKGILLIGFGICLSCLAFKVAVVSASLALIGLIAALACGILGIQKILKFEGEDQTQRLPDEILLEILKLLSARDSLALPLVCSRWKDVGADQELWKHFLYRDFDAIPDETHTDLKKYYQELSRTPFLPHLLEDKSQLLNWARKMSFASVAVSPNQKSIVWQDQANHRFVLEKPDNLYSEKYSSKKSFWQSFNSSDNCSLNFTNDGKKIIGQFYYGGLYFWDAQGNLIEKWEEDEISPENYSPNGNKLIYFSKTAIFTVRDLVSDYYIDHYKPFQPSFLSAFSHDEMYLFLDGSSHLEGKYSLFLFVNCGSETYKYLYALEFPSVRRIWTTDFSPSGKQFGVLGGFTDSTPFLRIYQTHEKTYVAAMEKLKIFSRPLIFISLNFISEDVFMINGETQDQPFAQLWRVFPDRLEHIRTYNGHLIANGGILKQIDAKGDITLRSFMPESHK